jgi:hypothetical protein
LKNEIVYLEGEKSTFVYIVYDGTFNLLKNKYEKQINEIDYINHSNKFTILKLCKGDISGFELVSEGRYNYTLQVTIK